MPELPEVEVSRQSLWRHMEGGVFLAPEVLRSDVIRVLSPGLQFDEITGTHAVDLKRRGKYLLWTVANETGKRFLLIHHFRMTGALIYSEKKTLNPRLMKHVHVIFPVRDKEGRQAYLFWHDIRRFGLLEWMREDDFATSAHTILKLGPEPLSPDFTASYLKAKATQHKSLRLPAFFLNQQVVAGLGNIYVNEALFLSGLHPDSLAGKLRLQDCECLIHIFRDILDRSIKLGGTSFRNYFDGDGRRGSNQRHLLVYGRQGLPCVRCGSILESVTNGGRRTVFCPRCQNKKGKPGMLFYTSGYSTREDGRETSIRAFHYDSQKGFSPSDRHFPDLIDVSYIIQDSIKRRLYGVMETDQGSVFALDMTTVDASPDIQAIGGGGPCHLCTWRDYVITANYGSGTLSVLYHGENGLMPLGDIRHYGSGPNSERQDAPHAHWVGISPDKNYLLAVDLGCDAVFAYDLKELDACLTELRRGTESGTNADLINREITLSAKYSSDFPAGSGPRHLIASPDGKQIYVAGELSAELFVMDYEDGKLSLSQTLDISAPDGLTSSRELAPSAIRITDNGAQVLIAVRGTDCLWSFNRSKDGKLTYGDHKHVGAIWPRDFNLMSDQRSIIVACERSHRLTAIRLDPKNGKLTATEQQIEMTAPSCILPL